MSLNMHDEVVKNLEVAISESRKLSSLPSGFSLVSDVGAHHARQQSNSSQLSNMVKSQMDIARCGIEALEKAHSAFFILNKNFELIERTYLQNETQAEREDRSQHLDVFRSNINRKIKLWLTSMLELNERLECMGKLRPEDKEMVLPMTVDHCCAHNTQVQKVYNHHSGPVLSKTALATKQTAILNSQGNKAVAPKLSVTEIGFEKLCAMEAPEMVAEFIFEDNGVKDLIANFYQNEWIEGEITECLIATFGDYFSDAENLMTEKSFRRFSEVCLEKIIISFFHGLLNMNDYMNAEIIERMALDEEALEEFFKQYTTPQILKERIVTLSDVRDLVSADSVESFILTYSKLLSSHSDCQPVLVEKLLALREEIPKNEAFEIVKKCQKMYMSSIAGKRDPKVGNIFSRIPGLLEGRM